jgi:hypothetical protein
LYWTLLITHNLQIDLANAFMSKQAANEVKYPVEEFRGTSRKYNDPSSDR